ncbi:hypothetical protein [Brevibacterium aurantiacum]|uniref:Lipoprotein n=1 Tax=Brevibacterium aurantiacum TaxID=273384 RepID=A0A2A3Z522_BREAU|nr:hypothetical protein [Brevibacterium aurantiacum]AOP52385.1 hypothetical protein BLSMQ_0671 [Brevibacterium aurantiacum]AZL11926.1 hypothetical protein CXR25_03195 [Brevibacterium aurantiacum]AZT96156.1 hypothetical protein CXR27_03395 [Brevibacterium aurantiacum]PCC46654.1 hypothetical protein CIK64_11395 [Brevibacterium aurantiacum]PCC50839.1 hypothetical protein CIK62_08030 [Brevibacterium aurantiacum]
MKKLALAATVALGLTAFGAGPATAVELGATPTDTAPEEANQTSAHSAAGDDDSEGSATSTDHALALKYAVMTPLEVTQGKGIEYTIDGLKAGDVVTPILNAEEREEVTVKKDGAFDGSVVADEKPEAPGNISFLVNVERDGKSLNEYQTDIGIIEGDRGEYNDGTLLVDPEPETNDTVLSTDGINLTMVNCSADDDVRFRAFKKNKNGQTKVWEKSQLTGKDKSASVRFVADSSKDLWGKYVITAECGDLDDSVPLTVYIDN